MRKEKRFSGRGKSAAPAWRGGTTALALFILFGAGQSLKAGLAPEDLYEQAAPSVMTLAVDASNGESFLGNAFLVFDADLALTAWHVVYDATRIEAKFSNGDRVRVIGCVDKDPARDLALIKLARPMRDHPLLRVADSCPRIGSRIYVIGAPKGFDFSISFGLLSQLRPIDGLVQYQLACPVSSGNSGGPVLNTQGEVVGLVSWRQPDAESLAFAVPSTQFGALATRNPVVEWEDVIASTGARPSSGRESVHAPSGVGDSEDLQHFLNARVGRTISVTCAEKGKSETFRFEVNPPKKREEH